MKRNTLSVLLIVSLIAVFATTAMAAITTVSGKVTSQGTILTEAGKEYTVTGEKAIELKKNIDKMIEAKGTVQEEEGKTVIAIMEYKLIDEAIKKAPEKEIKK